MKLTRVLLPLIFIILVLTLSFFLTIDDYDISFEKLSQSIISLGTSSGTIHPYRRNPELDYFNVTLDHGLKISYRGYAVTYQSVFIMDDGTQYALADIPPSIEKDLWKTQIKGNKYKYGADFNNVSTYIKNNLKFVVFHRTNATKEVNGAEIPMTLDDIQGRIKRQGNTIILNNKVYISHSDILRTYNIPVINRSDIVIGGLNNSWIVCDDEDCSTNHTEFNWKDNGDGTWNISFDPTITIDEEDVVSDALLTNVTAETGDANFTHLNISETSPYDQLVAYYPFDNDLAQTTGTTHYDFSKNNLDATGLLQSNVSDVNCLTGFGNCSQHDGGNSDAIEVDADLTSVLSNYPFTLSAWARSKDLGGGIILEVVNKDEPDEQYAIGQSSLGYAFINARCTTARAFVSTVSINDSKWHHVAGVFDSLTLHKLYIDGVNIGNQTASVNFCQPNRITIGHHGDSTPATGLTGQIDEAMVFNTSLTGAQIKEIYNNRSARFVPTGKQEFNNQSYLNLSGNRMNVSTTFDNNFDGNLSLTVGYYDGSWHTTNPQNVTSGTNATFTTSDTTTNITLNYTLIVGPNQTSSFYTPIVYGDIIIGNYTVTAVDSTPPNVTINLPGNATYLNTTDFNVTAIDETSMTDGGCWVSIDAGVTNLTLLNTTNNDDYNATNTSVPDGEYHTLVWCNDSNNNVNNTETVDFQVDTIYPDLKIVYPTSNNTNSTDTGLNVNYTVADTNLDSCWYSNDSYSKNTTLTNCANITTITWVEDKHNVTIWANDSANNVNQSDISFTIDTQPPYFTDYANLTIAETTLLDYDINATDALTEVDCLIINWTINLSMACNGTLTNSSEISAAEHLINLTVNDTLNNQNSTLFLLNITAVDSTNPEMTITHPVNNTNYSSATQELNYTYVEENPDSCWYSNDSGATNSTPQTMGNNWTLINAEGSNNKTLYCNDTSNNQNSTIIFFNIDTIYPTISITNPTNNTNLSSQTFDLNYTYVELNGDSCWYSNNSGATNSTHVDIGTNWTDLTDSDGDRNRTVYCNDTTNNINNSIIYFTIDITPPDINITYPSNDTDYTDTSLNINYTRSDASTVVDSCWYHNDTNPVNTTLANCVNITTATWSVGNHNVTIWANDTLNNVNYSYVAFNITTADTTPPNVTINLPTNTTYTSNSIVFNASVYDTNMTLGGCWATIDIGVTNLTLTNTTNHSIYNATNTSVPDGGYNALFYCNDSANNINNTEGVNFSVDTIYPEITITNPTNNSNLSSNTFDLNYTYVEVNGDSCWYSNDTGATNSSLVSLGTNWTNLIGAEGISNRTIYCNDTANQLNSTIVIFTIDTIYPNITISTPANNSNSTDTGLDINYTAEDDNLDSCWYSNDSYAANTSLAGCANITSITWIEGFHNVTIWANDSSNNVNESFVNFTIDISPPAFAAITNQTLNNETALSYDIDATDAYTDVDCFTVNNTGNFSITCAGVLTNATQNPVGIFYLNITVNDTLNNINSSIMFVNYTSVADTTPPYFTTIANYTHTVNTSFTQTIVANDETNFSSYALNDTSVFTINISNGTMTNVTGLINETIYYLNVTINDTSNNLNSSVFWINITNVTFSINVTSPENTTYDTSSIYINLSTIGSPDSYWYSLDNATNVTFTPNATVTGIGWEAWHDIIVYVNDTSGTELSAKRRFFVGIEENFWIWFDLFLIFLLFLIVGTYWKDYVFLFASGCLSLLMGIWVFNDGITIYGVTGWWVYPFAWILTGLGIILTTGVAYEWLNDMSGGDF